MEIQFIAFVTKKTSTLYPHKPLGAFSILSPSVPCLFLVLSLVPVFFERFCRPLRFPCWCKGRAVEFGTQKVLGIPHFIRSKPRPACQQGLSTPRPAIVLEALYSVTYAGNLPRKVDRPKSEHLLAETGFLSIVLTFLVIPLEPVEKFSQHQHLGTGLTRTEGILPSQETKRVSPRAVFVRLRDSRQL